MFGALVTSACPSCDAPFTAANIKAWSLHWVMLCDPGLPLSLIVVRLFRDAGPYQEPTRSAL